MENKPKGPSCKNHHQQQVNDTPYGDCRTASVLVGMLVGAIVGIGVSSFGTAVVMSVGIAVGIGVGG